MTDDFPILMFGLVYTPGYGPAVARSPVPLARFRSRAAADEYAAQQEPMSTDETAFYSDSSLLRGYNGYTLIDLNTIPIAGLQYETWQEMLRDGYRILAIKKYKEDNATTLRRAVDAIDAYASTLKTQ